MDDIAQKSGVSRTAVSLILNGQSSRIPEATRQRIIETAAEMGYQTNQLAKAMARGERMRTFGYLVASPRYEPYWNTIIAALEAAEKAGFSMKVFSSQEDLLLEQVRQCIGLRLGGLLVRVDGDKSAALEAAKRANVPVVVVDEGLPVPYGAIVAADDAPGCGMALDHLIGLGHRRIAFITSDFPRYAGGKKDIGIVREQLFRQQMAQRGLNVPAGYITGESTMVYGLPEGQTIDDRWVRVAVQSLLAHPSGAPTAIFCWRDETAILAIAECRRQGFRVPEDISLVGFSDISSAALLDPPLSTVKSPWQGIGELAVQQLVQSFETTSTSVSGSHTVPSGFVARRSSGPAPNT